MRNLMALLMACSPEDLARIAGRWDVDLPRASKAERAAVLGREMLRDASAHRLWENLSDAARMTFFAFTERPEQRLSEMGHARDGAALLECLESGVLWAFEESERAGGIPSLTLPPVPDPTLVIPPELCRLADRLLADLERGDTSGLPLDESLSRLGTGELENLAAYWGLAAEPGSYTRDELVDSLLNHMSGASTERVAREAPETARKVYEALLAADGRALTRDLGETLGVEGSELRDAVADLEERLLALETYAGGWLLYAPLGPAHAVPGRSAGVAPTPTDPPPRHFPSPVWAPAWDLINVLRALDLHDVPAEPDGGLPTAFTTRFDAALVTRPTDPAANLRFLHGAARTIGLAETRDGAAKPTQRVHAWTESPIEKQTRRLLEHWVDNGAPGETDNLAGAPGFRPDAETLRSGRLGVLEHLSHCEPEMWYDVSDFLQLIQERNPFILRPQNRLVRDLGSAGARKAIEGWKGVEGVWLGGLLSGVLPWLHVTERTAEPEEVFRTTADGAWLAGRTPRPPVAPAAPRIAISAEGRLRVTAPDGRLLWAVAGFARPARAGGRPVYLVDRRSVARARSAGITAETMVALFRKHAENGVPPKLVEQIREWGREPHRITMHPALLVECETEAGADELMVSPIVRGHHPRRLDTTSVLLTLPHENMDEELKTLIRRLTRSGLFA